jgi:Ca2+/Na+ antiporter
MGLSDFFVDVSTLPDGPYGLIQLMTLLFYYGYILYVSANMIGDGSELLLLVPKYAGVVGSCVLPVLGAVPDGMIVLFSGLGPDAQEQLDVGVGALAGSTVMLITIPWLLSIYAGRVDIENGRCKYTKEGRKAKGSVTGVKNSDGVRTGGVIMLATSIGYLILQVPAIFFEAGGASQAEVAESEKFYAGMGLFVTIFMFIGYLKYQVDNTDNLVANHAHVQLVIKLIEEDDNFTLRLALYDELKHHKAELTRRLSALGPLDGSAATAVDYKAISTNDVWAKLPDNAKERITDIITYFWLKFVRTNKANKAITGAGKGARIQLSALRSLFEFMGDNFAAGHLEEVFNLFDTNKNNTIELEEFIKGTCQYLWDYEREQLDTSTTLEQFESALKSGESSGLDEAGDDGDEEDDEDEMPDELKDLDPKDQQRRLISMSFQTMGIGTFLVVLFSDPMCDVLSEVGTRTGIPAFYVSFVLAPLASNAAELLASYNYALKKSPKSISIALQALQGAACMNNTFCLSIFMGLVYFKGLSWEYFAETVAIMLCQVGVAFASMKEVQTMGTAYMVVMLYPACLLLVAAMEAAGFD